MGGRGAAARPAQSRRCCAVEQSGQADTKLGACCPRPYPYPYPYPYPEP